MEQISTNKIATNNKMFYVDLMKNANGYYLKLSEWSNGKKSSVFIPYEGLEEMIGVFGKLKTVIDKGESNENS